MLRQIDESLHRGSDAPPEATRQEQGQQDQDGAQPEQRPEGAAQRRLDDLGRHADERRPARHARAGIGPEHLRSLQVVPLPDAIGLPGGAQELVRSGLADEGLMLPGSGHDAVGPVDHRGNP